MNYPQTKTSLNVLGSQITIHLHGRETNGLLSIVETCDEPNSGPPPHIHHRESETFHVLEGEYEISRGAEKFLAKKGDTFFGPKGVPHTFRSVGAQSGRLLVTMTPAGFEGFFEEVGVLTPEQQEVPRVLELGQKYGLEFLPPPGA